MANDLSKRQHDLRQWAERQPGANPFHLARPDCRRYDLGCFMAGLTVVAPRSTAARSQGPARAEPGGLPPTTSPRESNSRGAFGSLAGIHKEESRWNWKKIERPPS